MYNHLQGNKCLLDLNMEKFEKKNSINMNTIISFGNELALCKTVL